VDFVTPFRDRTMELLEDRAELDAVIRAGAEKAGLWRNARWPTSTSASASSVRRLRSQP
jgi:hypothetical protein